ncbi:MAG: excinuclease ABC subunit UvrB [Patescibacteria group bacterium]|nr:excinuclease ABC subunit UvrB [Patescibacteria group bacterium]
MPDDQKFKLVSDFKPTGDQPGAIAQLVKGIKAEKKYQTLLGATGTGKTFVMAQLIQNLQRPTLVIAHNKTLAAQLCSEFKDFFPDNAVSYFVSYYDYYQPEAYMPHTDTFIEKDAQINDEINKYRHAATSNLLSRRDSIVVASVSCIYGLGSPEEYKNLRVELAVGEERKRDKLLRHLTDLQYVRSKLEFKQGMFHVLGDTLEVFPPGMDTQYRIEFFGDEIERITEVDSFTGEIVADLTAVTIFPAKHDVTTEAKIKRAVPLIRADLEERYKQLKDIGKNLEAERIKTRTEYDLEILQETGYVTGIENYIRYLSGREPGEQPATLIDYFPDDFLMIVDESHMTIPQVGAMHNGNLSRKQTLIEYGFRMPSALDNRPLKFEEFEDHIGQAVFVSATPGKYEFAHCKKADIAEQIIRPTGLLDPVVEVRPTANQMKDVRNELDKVLARGERALLTTLTKKMSEALTKFLTEQGLRVRYLHSDIDTLERIEILRDLRLGEFDILVGINLLREGLDLPEVSFIGILDADKRGFLRSESALIQTIGRCARNINGFVVMYGDVITPAMDAAIGETERRRKKQKAYNEKHGITPQTIIKKIHDIEMHRKNEAKKQVKHYDGKKIPREERERLLSGLNAEMDMAAQNMEFEKAAEIRDEIERLEEEWGN